MAFEHKFTIFITAKNLEDAVEEIAEFMYDMFNSNDLDVTKGIINKAKMYGVDVPEEEKDLFKDMWCFEFELILTTCGDVLPDRQKGQITINPYEANAIMLDKLEEKEAKHG